MTTIDLHLHTHYSDGTWSPADLVNHAKTIGLRQIAITDHDTVAGIEEAQSSAGTELEIIPGIEINTIHHSQSGKRRDIHILGYFLDTNAPALKMLISHQREARFRHAEKCVARIVDGGVPISMELVLRHTGRGGIGKMHLTQAILAAGGASDAAHAYQTFLSRECEYFVERESVQPHQAIRAIIESGGIASIAHPGKEEDIFDLILELKQSGLSALEAFHRIHSADRIKHYLQFAERSGLLVTGGSDCHGPFREYGATIGTVPVPPKLLENLRMLKGSSLTNASMH